MDEGTSLFTLVFTAIQSGLLSDMLPVGSRLTATEDYDVSEQTLDVALYFTTGAHVDDADFAL